MMGPGRALRPTFPDRKTSHLSWNAVANPCTARWVTDERVPSPRHCPSTPHNAILTQPRPGLPLLRFPPRAWSQRSGSRPSSAAPPAVLPALLKLTARVRSPSPVLRAKAQVRGAFPARALNISRLYARTHWFTKDTTATCWDWTASRSGNVTTPRSGASHVMRPVGS